MTRRPRRRVTFKQEGIDGWWIGAFYVDGTWLWWRRLTPMDWPFWVYDRLRNFGEFGGRRWWYLPISLRSQLRDANEANGGA